MSNLAEKFSKQLGQLPVADAPQWLVSLRKAGVDAFGRSGLPTGRTEAWKYTSLRPLEKSLQSIALANCETAQEATVGLAVAGGLRVTLVNGSFLELAGPGTEGVTVQPLAAAITADHPGLRGQLESLDVGSAAQAFSALNNATLEAGVYIHVAAGVKAGRVVLDWQRGGQDASVLFNTRVCLCLEAGAELELVEQYAAGPSPQPALNVVLQGELHEQAQLLVARYQQEAAGTTLITRTEIRQAANSRLAFTGLDLGGGLVRHDLHAQMLGRGAECHLHGAYLPRGRSHMDVHLDIEHMAPGCKSVQFYRGVLDDRGRAVFNGRVHIHAGADGADASQSNANLVLSPHAEIDTKPELEIYADEVVASHGATVGQLDEDALFYLRSRGLAPEQAHQLLVRAFTRSVVDFLPEGDLRTAFSQCLSDHLESEQQA